MPLPGFPRISIDPRIMAGQACIEGTRVTVSTVIELIADGGKPEEIVTDYPFLTIEDVKAALDYAAWRVKERELPLAQ